MTLSLKSIPDKTRAAITHQAYCILANAHSTTKSFLDAFESVRTLRKARGTATD